VLSAVSGPVFVDPLVALLPDHAPDALHVDALVVVQLIVVESPDVMGFGVATIVTTGARGVVTVTRVEVCVFVPPAPKQVSLNVLFEVSGPVSKDPLVGRLPDHASDASHVVACVLVQLNMLESPENTSDGEASREIVGATDGWVTTTVTFASALAFSAFAQVSVKVLSDVKLAVVNVPFVARPPIQAPEATHWSASDDDHVRVVGLPETTEGGLARMLTLGDGNGGRAVTITVVEAWIFPLSSPEQVSVKVLLFDKAAVGSDPLTGFAPDQAFDATHWVAFVEAQLIVEVAPEKIVPGDAAIVNVGGW
jgi:hypothetical protein